VKRGPLRLTSPVVRYAWLLMAPDKREYPERPMIGVGGVIVDDGQVLLVRRGHPPLAGEWSIS